MLFQRNAKARVFYIGGAPRQEEEKYCEEMRIQRIDKKEIYFIIADIEGSIF